MEPEIKEIADKKEIRGRDRPAKPLPETKTTNKQPSKCEKRNKSKTTVERTKTSKISKITIRNVRELHGKAIEALLKKALLDHDKWGAYVKASADQRVQLAKLQEKFAGCK